MAKKKKRKKKSPSAAAGGGGEASSNRAARKEAARREREKAIRAHKRRRMLRRAGIAALAVAVLGGGGFLIWSSVRESSQAREELAGLASRAGCGEILEVPEEGQDHVQQPPDYENVPATSGPHFAQWLDPAVSVYDQPFDPAFEFRAVHNLEHGYVIMYYKQEGENALPEDVLSTLTDVAESERKVILAPYPSLEDDENLVFAAWNRALRCDVTGDAGLTADVADGFIQTFREGSEAPEPTAA